MGFLLIKFFATLVSIFFWAARRHVKRRHGQAAANSLFGREEEMNQTVAGYGCYWLVLAVIALVLIVGFIVVGNYLSGNWSLTPQPKPHLTPAVPAYQPDRIEVR